MFGRSTGKREGGVMAVVPYSDRIDVAHVVRMPGARPQLNVLESFQNGARLADSLARLASARPLRKTYNTTLLAPGTYQVTQMEALAVPAEERKSALRWKLKDLVDFPVESASIDVLDVPMEGNRQPTIFAVAAAGESVGHLMVAFNEAKVPLAAVDIPEMAQRNVSALLEEPNRGLALLSVSETGTLLTITRAGELYLARRTDITSTQIASADADGRERLLERVMLEVQRTLDNFDRQFGFVSVSALVVSISPAVEGMLAYLAENLYLPVRPLSLQEVLDCSAIPELSKPERQGQCLFSIGAALRTLEIEP